MRNSVVLPAPFGPSSPMTPGVSSKETWRSARKPPAYVFDRLRTLSVFGTSLSPFRGMRDRLPDAHAPRRIARDESNAPGNNAPQAVATTSTAAVATIGARHPLRKASGPVDGNAEHDRDGHARRTSSAPRRDEPRDTSQPCVRDARTMEITVAGTVQQTAAASPTSVISSTPRP